MAINSISPFILNARLKPLMARTAALGAAATAELRGEGGGSGGVQEQGGASVSLSEALLSLDSESRLVSDVWSN